jgi:hypothetical protein
MICEEKLGQEIIVRVFKSAFRLVWYDASKLQQFIGLDCSSPRLASLERIFNLDSIHFDCGFAMSV